ncbi:MAG: hypothetical protein JW751_00295 [Polyangiaceae bacterium]|nr:hypothetical protein [Polyangiaceae bacterium]
MAGCLILACSQHRAAMVGPPPEYEPPRIIPWDGGAGETPEDPFAASAEGEWITEERDSGVPLPEAGSVGAAGRGPVSLDSAAGQAMN